MFVKRFAFSTTLIVLLLTACGSKDAATADSAAAIGSTASADSAAAVSSDSPADSAASVSSDSPADSAAAVSSDSFADSIAPILDCPFTYMSWGSTADDMIAAEGNEYSTYDSVYGGICYTYPREYEGYHGIVKYMFDDNNLLMCVAWTYSSDDADELYELYRSINASVTTAYGESGYQTDRPDNYGNVWYLENGDIVLSTMLTSESKALQYAYLHPQVSGPATSQ